VEPESEQVASVGCTYPQLSFIPEPFGEMFEREYQAAKTAYGVIEKAMGSVKPG
jgi:hypothetical protein